MNRGEYWLYLTDAIGGGRSHHLLLSNLFDREFRWSYKIASDANRARDGQMLRDRYANEVGDYILFEDKMEPCNVLEMLVALSIRIEDDIMADPGSENPGVWFWEMLDNLEISQLDDRRFDEAEVNDILTKWMRREYEEDGRGGLFPLNHPTKDQRLVPIWDQANEYLNESLKGDFTL